MVDLQGEGRQRLEAKAWRWQPARFLIFFAQLHWFSNFGFCIFQKDPKTDDLVLFQDGAGSLPTSRWARRGKWKIKKGFKKNKKRRGKWKIKKKGSKRIKKRQGKWKFQKRIWEGLRPMGPRSGDQCILFVSILFTWSNAMKGVPGLWRQIVYVGQNY